MDLNKRHYKYIIIAVILFIIGYMVGSYVTLKTFARLASGFIDPELVEIAYTQYKNNLGSCFPAINISNEILQALPT